MIIRKATYWETKEIVKHAATVVEEATMGHVKADQGKALQMVSPVFLNDGYYLVSIENNNIQGWIGIGVTLDFYTNKTVGIIPEIYVLPTYRKQGVAEELCMDAFVRLKEKGLERVQLNVFSGNKAKRIYDRLGFRDVSTLMEREL